jgi:hypothetical protein
VGWWWKLDQKQAVFEEQRLGKSRWAFCCLLSGNGEKKSEKSQYLVYSLYTYWTCNCSLTAVLWTWHKAAITHTNGFVVALNSCGAQRLILLTLQDADSPFFRSTHLRTYYVQFNMEVLALLYVCDWWFGFPPFPLHLVSWLLTATQEHEIFQICMINIKVKSELSNYHYYCTEKPKKNTKIQRFTDSQRKQKCESGSDTNTSQCNWKPHKFISR